MCNFVNENFHEFFQRIFHRKWPRFPWNFRPKKRVILFGKFVKLCFPIGYFRTILFHWEECQFSKKKSVEKSSETFPYAFVYSNSFNFIWDYGNTCQLFTTFDETVTLVFSLTLSAEGLRQSERLIKASWAINTKKFKLTKSYDQ